MGARNKLNAAAINGSLLIAAVASIAFESWFVFWLAAGLLIAGNLYASTIRPSRGRSGASRR